MIDVVSLKELLAKCLHESQQELAEKTRVSQPLLSTYGKIDLNTPTDKKTSNKI